MADWRQIQARIRKAKNAQDAPAKLSELYKRTRDAMVAWELGAIEEKAERTGEAVKWFTIAAQRFRRADWKKKAEEALTRLGVDVSTLSPAAAAEAESAIEPHHAPEHKHDHESSDTATVTVIGEIVEEEDEMPTNEQMAEASASGETPQTSADGVKKKRRRGRRGGRGRRRSPAGAAPGLPAASFAKSSAPSSPAASISEPPRLPIRTIPFERPSFDTPIPVHRPSRHEPVEPVEHAAPQLPSERTAHGRAGDPALASRIAQLESMLRRLVASPLHRLEEADTAPAGPGVFLLSDADQISSYYVEACQTLRVGIGNLGRSNSSRSSSKSSHGSKGYSESGLKAKLAEHLEINENKVSQYLKDHCVVRWIQMDDDAHLLAHFAVSVLRTPLNLG